MKIAFVLYPQALATGITVPAEMFNAANLIGKGRKVPLSIDYVAEKPGLVQMTGAVTLNAEVAFDDQTLFEWIFLPPMWGSPWATMAHQHRLQDWLKQQYASGAKIISTGTSVGILAFSGLLAGKVATTHWYFLERFRKRFADIKFQTEHFITHQDGIYCVGSINAQTELVLYFIEQQFGEEALALVEQQFMHELKRNFTTPFYQPGGQVHDDELVSLVQSWIRTHYTEPVVLEQMADIAGQSSRQLRRRFIKATGETPIQYLMRFRLQQAQSLLRESNLTATEIAVATGFASSAYFSRSFKKHSGLSPGDYRKMVRRKMFSE